MSAINSAYFIHFWSLFISAKGLRILPPHMAELVICPLIQIIIDKLASPFLETFHDLYNLRENVRKLQQSLPTARALLEDAQERQTREKAVEDWILKLKDKAYESEDLLDEISVEAEICRRRSSNRFKVASFFWPFRPSNNLFELAKNLQNKLQELDDIIKQGGLALNLREKVVEKVSERFCCSSSETGSSLLETKIVGREMDKQEILRFLLPSCSDGGEIKRDVLVFPIVGIGGIGKTTMAQLVYKDEKVSNYFNLKIWIHVSKVFDRRKIMMNIIESATQKKCKLLSMNLLESQLQESLSGKRFLLVLDDVWNENKEEWDKLGDLLKCGAEGSRVVVTTRSRGVASIVGGGSCSGGTSVYHLKGLTEHACWILFKQQAFGPGEEEEEEEDSSYPTLLVIGKMIIKKCGGVPLAAKTLGSLLRFKREERDWFNVQESEIWNHEECQRNGILPALTLSYTNLPLHLKQCFVFCSLFPKSYEINKEKLIYIWIAEGLILPNGGTRQLEEDIADGYFSELLRLSFFDEVSECGNGSNRVYKMHDLIHDLARSIGGNDFEILGHGLSPNRVAQLRHLTIISSSHQIFQGNLFDHKRLRTLLLLCSGGGSCEKIMSFLPSFIYLRVLDFSRCGIKSLEDESIGALICLRYLDLSNNPILALPLSICNLCNLQTLNLSGCCNLVELPYGLATVISLRHLDIKGCDALKCMPPGVGNLVHLQTLPVYIVGKGSGESITELCNLKLRNELTIKCLENVRDAKQAKTSNLWEKRYLQSLRLEWGSTSAGPDSIPEKATASTKVTHKTSQCSFESLPGDNVEEILSCLEPYENLKRLYIKDYPGKKFPSWDLPYLVEVVLINCRRCKNMPSLGQLSLLQRLLLQGMDAVECLSKEFYGSGNAKPFPSLKDLTLRDFPCLEEWSSHERPAFPCLKRLVMDNCPNLRSVPTFPSVEHLELRNCNAEIMNSLENITSLSHLVIDTFPGLLHISGRLLENNASLASLEIYSCQNLHFLPSEIQNVSVLKSLIISSCQKLSRLPPGLHKLKHLQFFEISGCHSLSFLPQEGIGASGSLRTFSIENCNNLKSLSGFHHVKALEHLSIMSCPEITSLPESFRDFSALRSLNIVSCPGLVYLPASLQHVTTLQSLVLHTCPSLTDLPDWLGKFSSLRSLAISNCKYLKALPEGLKCLTALQHLSIQDCPHLSRLCTKRGTEWQKIAHIPHIYVS